MKKMFLALGLLAVASLTHSQDLSLSLSSELDTSRQALVPTLTWSTTPAATSCAAQGGWTGAKAASGTETLAASTASSSYSLVCQWPGNARAVVTWTPPTTNMDGSAYTNPGGYRIQYGTSATELNESVYVQQPSATTWTSGDLAPGTWFFGVRAFNAQGLESDLSNVVSKVTSAGTSRTGSVELEVRVPRPPVAQ